MSRRKTNLQVVQDESAKQKTGGIKLRLNDLDVIEPITNNQKLFFEQYNIKEVILELWIHTSSGLNTMITGAIMSFRSI